jgi:NTP pyrophosphatase (non-canonical NTP hydrolase)
MKKRMIVDGCMGPQEVEVDVVRKTTMTFSRRNRLRCEAKNGFNHKLESWSLSDWMTALAGEVGEAANIIKKLNRVRDGIPGNKESVEELRAALADELADVAVYLDLMAQAAGFDLSTIRDAKFAKTSRKIGYVEEPFLEE